MLRCAIFFLFCGMLSPAVQAASKAHVITFGKWQSVRWMAGTSDDKTIELKVRSLLVDGKVKEYTTGRVHEVTENLFVVRRVFRVNDALPSESSNIPEWRWERGGWLAVDRVTGRISNISLPLMDPFRSVASWYRDYVAYCGLSEDATKLYAVIIQLGRRKPVLRKYVAVAAPAELPDAACLVPRWERRPSRVTFEIPGADKMVYAINARTLDIVDEDEQEDPSE
jgi:hypothetical protein